MKLLNIACGDRYHQDWINIDFHPDSKNVQRVNILDGLPFKDNSMDAIYCSHFLGHITEQQAIFVLSESKRLLKHNGICRIVVPSLENTWRGRPSTIFTRKISLDNYRALRSNCKSK